MELPGLSHGSGVIAYTAITTTPWSVTTICPYVRSSGVLQGVEKKSDEFVVVRSETQFSGNSVSPCASACVMRYRTDTATTTTEKLGVWRDAECFKRRRRHYFFIY
jgi:hypothetical protein